MKTLHINAPGPQEIAKISQHMKGLAEQVVFLGGAVVPLLVTDPLIMRFRETLDVDLIIKLASRMAHVELEEKLRDLHFTHDTSPGAPICRWRIEGIRVDIMPIDESILGFSNRWYPFAFDTAVPIQFPDGPPIRVISPVAFIATKLEAFRSPSREYHDDYFASHDLEDLLTVIDGRVELNGEIATSSADVRTYLSTGIKRLLEEPDFRDALPGHVETGPTNAARTAMLLEQLEQLANLN
ncbi:MAG: nucleotidyl transferase AbiEii/AbiGii toxin family protein [Bacteroidetes bacterium]|nr:nucleotidyl transferase AbiEii/AbiGii toxin family protein [Bacteroidota bacterium]